MDLRTITVQQACCSPFGPISSCVERLLASEASCLTGLARTATFDDQNRSRSDEKVADRPGGATCWLRSIAARRRTMVDHYLRPSDSVITRRSVLRAGSIVLLVVNGLSRGQPAATIPRVGLLWFASEASSAHLWKAFKEGMHDLGWLEGKSIEYRFVYANGDADRLRVLADELIGQKVAVIVVGSSQSAGAAHRATKTVPIVLAGVGNAVRAGLVASLAKPDGNITGFTSQQDEVVGKLVGILHEVAPGARRIAILLNESSPLHAAYWAGAQRACTALGLVALRVVASTPAQLATAVGAIVRQRSQAVVVTSDSMYFTERAKLQELMQTARLPTAYAVRDNVVAGGLLGYGYDAAGNYRNAARYVDKILKGAKPADLPVEQATKFELVINLKTAKTLGLTIPQSLLLRADEVIQ